MWDSWILGAIDQLRQAASGPRKGQLARLSPVLDRLREELWRDGDGATKAERQAKRDAADRLGSFVRVYC